MDLNLEQLFEAQDAAINSPPPIPSYRSGRSIVTSTYRSELPSAFVLLNELRRLEFNLPVEIFYRDDELNDDEIKELSAVIPGLVTCKKICAPRKDFKDRWGNIKGWSSKYFAIIESEYSENLWIDCDNVPIRNCIDLFDDQEYVAKGSLFWRDVYSIDRADLYHSGSEVWKIFRVDPNDGEPFESGQFLVNKPAVWQQLSLMGHYTEYCQLYYQLGGDAECWRMAWQRASIHTKGYHVGFNYHASDQVPYGMMPYGPFHKGVANPWKKYGGGSVMVQRDRSGKELFNHRNINKWRWRGENPFNDDVTNEITYHMIMRHIKAKYGVSD